MPVMARSKTRSRPMCTLSSRVIKLPASSMGYRTPVQSRDGVRVLLLVHGRHSTHHRSREIEMQRRANKKAADLYSQVVQ